MVSGPPIRLVYLSMFASVLVSFPVRAACTDVQPVLGDVEQVDVFQLNGTQIDPAGTMSADELSAAAWKECDDGAGYYAVLTTSGDLRLVRKGDISLTGVCFTNNGKPDDLRTAGGAGSGKAKSCSADDR
ncbi:hypothetical protein [Pacificimonas aurantium]|uniref:Uncharacterized protein n=1 Tax=Pacificimonas aurantium TaxID=1250540 RepID=A0ABS7WQY6_9SPHN|nr:hypothetical protein [Pacificimonas aurantium]MBZ6380028.1 hypothetical protein [Pacificimonas aurantium]